MNDIIKGVKRLRKEITKGVGHASAAIAPDVKRALRDFRDRILERLESAIDDAGVIALDIIREDFNNRVPPDKTWAKVSQRLKEFAREKLNSIKL